MSSRGASLADYLGTGSWFASEEGEPSETVDLPAAGNHGASHGRWHPYLVLLSYARGWWKGWAWLLIVTIGATAFGLAAPWPLKVLIDNVLGHKPLPHAVARLPGTGHPSSLLVWVVVATLTSFGLSSALNVVTTRMWIKVGYGMVYDLSHDLFERIQRRSIVFHTTKPIGDSISRIAGDSWAVHQVVDSLLFSPVHASFYIIGMVVLMARMDAGLTLVAVAAAPLMAVGSLAAARAVRRASTRQRQVDSALNSHVQQTLSGISVVQSFGQEQRHHLRFRRFARSAIRVQRQAAIANNVNDLLTGLVTTGGSGVVLWIGADHVLHQRLTVGGLLIFMAYLGGLQLQVRPFTNIYTSLQTSRGSIDRVMEVLDAEPEVTDAPGAVALRRVRGHVVFDDVGFGYEPDRPVLQNVSLEARPGETVAIVGHTGAGKSTLVSLVLRLFDPTDGTVSIDGHDLRDVQVASLRSQVSLVLQESFLFPISIRDNIAYGRPDASMKQIQAAAKAANAHEFIAKLPDGYDTIVGERGATLSGGERQRIAIARALLKDAPVLILDEPTSALDARTESLLLEALERLTKGRTTLIIAHRLSTIRNADRIVVLNEGRVVETGTHRQLVRRKGPYAALRNPGPAGTKVRVK
jgi:ATP-binding cassette, subfamily B, bacterial